MTKAKLLILIAIVFIFSGCFSKTVFVDKIIYKKQPKYNFTKIDIDGLYVDAKESSAILYNENIEIKELEKTPYKSKVTLKPKGTQQLCTYIVLDSVEPFKLIIKDHYNNQIDRYNEIGDSNDKD